MQEMGQELHDQQAQYSRALARQQRLRAPSINAGRTSRAAEFATLSSPKYDPG